MKKSDKGKVKMNIKIDIKVKNNPQNPRLVSKKKREVFISNIHIKSNFLSFIADAEKLLSSTKNRKKKKKTVSENVPVTGQRKGEIRVIFSI